MTQTKRPPENPERFNALANIALIGPKTNIRISKKNPMDYVIKYGIGDVQLEQQFIEPSLASTSVDQFPGWVQARAERLAKVGNELLAWLRGELKNPEALASEVSSEHAFNAE